MIIEGEFSEHRVGLIEKGSSNGGGERVWDDQVAILVPGFELRRCEGC